MTHPTLDREIPPSPPSSPRLSLADTLRLRYESIALSIIELIPMQRIQNELFTPQNVVRFDRGDSVRIRLGIEDIYRRTDSLGLTTTERVGIIQQELGSWGKYHNLLVTYDPINDVIII